MQKTWLLQRFNSQADATIGALFYLEGDKPDFSCFTLEDEARKVKVPGETRIPAGRYQIKLRTEGGMHPKYAAKFPFHRGMLHLQNVPGFDNVYIHIGNTDEDTAGCILVGQSADSSMATIGKSVPAYSELYQEMARAIAAGDEVFIRIEDYA